MATIGQRKTLGSFWLTGGLDCVFVTLFAAPSEAIFEGLPREHA